LATMSRADLEAAVVGLAAALAYLLDPAEARKPRVGPKVGPPAVVTPRVTPDPDPAGETAGRHRTRTAKKSGS
ncbi:MAG: hypothetical protein MUF18_20755, partial [Fimbriiglobus sp.]|nr:hypothetical protein [Fimbriiglobus sp.]